MTDNNYIPFGAAKVIEGEQDYPPQSGLDRYKKSELIEMAHQWCDIVQEKIARVRGHLDSGTVSQAQSLWYCRIFGKYAGLLPTGPAVLTCGSKRKGKHMTPDKMPDEIWVLKSEMDTPYTGTFCDVDDGGEKYIRADLCPKPEKIEGLEMALRSVCSEDEGSPIIKAARAYLKLTEDKND